MPELSTLGSVIKPTYEGQANTNAFTDAEKSKLGGIEAGAQVNTVSPDDLSGFATSASLSSVATSGAYSDLSGVPSIPSVNFATVSAVVGDWRGEGDETLASALMALQSAIDA